MFEDKCRTMALPGKEAGSISVPVPYTRMLQSLGERRLCALILGNYLVYTPLPFVMGRRRQLLDIAMTALQALATLDSDERIREAWRLLKEVEDGYDARGDGSDG